MKKLALGIVLLTLPFLVFADTEPIDDTEDTGPITINELLETSEASESFDGPEGSWQGHSSVADCGPDRICAEWLQPGNSYSGFVCCIDYSDMFSNEFFGTCREVVRGPRGGESGTPNYL